MADDIGGIVGTGISALLGVGFATATLRMLNPTKQKRKKKRRDLSRLIA